MANNNPSGDTYGFSKMSAAELNKIIADTVKANGVLTDQKKEYVAATNEVIKENKKKIDAALDARSMVVQDGEHEQRVADFLKKSEAA